MFRPCFAPFTPKTVEVYPPHDVPVLFLITFHDVPVLILFTSYDVPVLTLITSHDVPVLAMFSLQLGFHIQHHLLVARGYTLFVCVTPFGLPALSIIAWLRTIGTRAFSQACQSLGGVAWVGTLHTTVWVAFALGKLPVPVPGGLRGRRDTSSVSLPPLSCSCEPFIM